VQKYKVMEFINGCWLYLLLKIGLHVFKGVGGACVLVTCYLVV